MDPEFLYTVIDLMIYPKHIVSKYEGDVKAFTQAPELNNLSYTGNLGPYRYKEWIRNDKIVMERNPDYYLGKIVELAEKDYLFENPLHPYTAALLSSL